MYPTIFQFGHLALPTFGVLAAIGLMLALALSERTARLVGIDADALWQAGFFTVIAAFVISRVLLVVLNFRTFLTFPMLLLAVPSLTWLGLLLTVFAAWYWLSVKRLPLLSVLDAWAPCGLLVWAFLALGHFAEGSDPGLPTAVPWGMAMPDETTRLHPVALYVAPAALALAVWSFRRLVRTRPPGENAAQALIAAGLVQFLASFVRQPGERAFAGLDLLQWLALAMLVAGGLLLANALRPAAMPGQASATR